MGKELKHLSRRDLIEIIYQLKKSEQDLQAENERLRRQLEEKRIMVEKTGSVADAALALTDVFSTAQAAADVYLGEIEQRRQDIERDYRILMDDARKKSEDMIQKAVAQREAIVSETKKSYRLLKKYNAAIEKKKMELAMRTRQE